MTMFVYGFLTAVGAYLFLKWIMLLAPLGDPETGYGCHPAFGEGGTRSQIKLRDTRSAAPPPPPPPSRAIHPLRGETRASVRAREDWQTYMSGYAHGMAVARGATERVQP